MTDSNSKYDSGNTSFGQKALMGLSLFLPGIFLLGFNVGTGSVTTMAKAGADYGMTLLWTIVASCLCTYFLINLYGRYTLVTGETALQAFRKHIHPAVGIFFIAALTFLVAGSVMGVMGIVAEICYEWSKTFIAGGIAPVYFAAFFSGLVFFIFWNGKTEFFERSLAVIVAVMAACFLINFFIMMPPPIDIIRGLVPSIPEVAPNSDKGPLLVVAAMVGTTVYSGLFIIRTTLVKEAGWTLEDENTQRNDALFAVVMMFVISAAIMAAAAGSLHVAGKGLEDAYQMIELLEPLAGSFAVTIFAFGIIAAGVSSQFPNVLMLPWLITDYTGAERDMTLPKYRIMVFLISLLGLVVPLFGARPIPVMIVSQSFNAVILPITVACIFYLTNRKDLMGAHKNSSVSNVILVAIFAFSIFTASVGVKGVWTKYFAKPVALEETLIETHRQSVPASSEGVVVRLS
jgi:Mn2+/Fe2+ NRAMP family transporter